jgi:aryl-alcohol dehydrogenase
MQIRAAVARAPDLPFEIVECDIAEPGSGQVLVRVKACGICHTDLAVKLQHIPVPLPKVLGHEGTGVIERVGPNVVGLAAGDPVLMSFG